MLKARNTRIILNSADVPLRLTILNPYGFIFRYTFFGQICLEKLYYLSIPLHHNLLARYRVSSRSFISLRIYIINVNRNL